MHVRYLVNFFFYRRTKTKNIISYQSCDYQKDRYCPQNTYRTKFTDEPSEYMQFDWSEHLVNSSHVEKLPNRGYTLKVYANNSECTELTPTNSSVVKVCLHCTK